jgi:serine/threonine-protein kinase
MGAPSHLGRYRVEGLIGRGSMGAVYAARDDEGRALAIKTLAIDRMAGGEDAEALRERFMHEARTALALHHPGILAALEAGEDDGLAWIAMERLDGTTLEAHTRAPALLPPPVALLAVARVADALACAHRLGVVHRDVKPANILIDLAADQVKLADFGLAAMAGGGRTRTGVMLGTPAYMAPELLAGQRPDARADLYALGVVLFELLTGRLPHGAESLGALMREVTTAPAPDVRTLRPDLPAVLADAVALALEKRPAHRIRDAAVWADDLRAIAALADAGSVTGLSPRAPDSGGPRHGAAGNP